MKYGIRSNMQGLRFKMTRNGVRCVGFMFYFVEVDDLALSGTNFLNSRIKLALYKYGG